MDKKTVISLPYFKLTDKEFTISGIKIKEYLVKELDKVNDINDWLSVGEYDKILRTRAGITKPFSMGVDAFGSAKFDVLELPKNDEDLGLCYITLLDLLTGHWKYALQHNTLFSPPPFANLMSLPPSYYDEKGEAPLYTFNESLIKKFESGIKLIQTYKRLQIALRRWRTTYAQRNDHLDIILDCCSSLVSLFSLEGELRLRLSLYVYHFLEKKKKTVLSQVYSIYGVRNDFIHGSKIPVVTDTKEAIILVAEVLSSVLNKNQMPDPNKLNENIGIVTKEVD
jgi:hypothetical protein